MLVSDVAVVPTGTVLMHNYDSFGLPVRARYESSVYVNGRGSTWLIWKRS